MPFKLACPFLPTMMWSCTEMPSGVAIWTIALVIWISACEGVGSPEGDARSHIKLERLPFLSLRRPHGEDVPDHPRKPDGDGQAIVEVTRIVVDLSETHD